MRLRNESKEKKGITVKYDMMTKLKNENILKTFSIARKNRYQVLEDGGLAIKEEDKDIGRDFQIMEKTYTEELCRKSSSKTSKEEQTMD